MPWYEKTAGNLLLRVIGAGLLALTYVAIGLLRRRVTTGSIESDPLAYLLAAGAFICASGGALLAALGPHIFDRIEVSERWRRIDRG